MKPTKKQMDNTYKALIIYMSAFLAGALTSRSYPGAYITGFFISVLTGFLCWVLFRENGSMSNKRKTISVIHYNIPADLQRFLELNNAWSFFVSNVNMLGNEVFLNTFKRAKMDAKLSAAFGWADTPQGIEYWAELSVGFREYLRDKDKCKWVDAPCICNGRGKDASGRECKQTAGGRPF